MLAFGWIILTGLALQALFWIPAMREGREPTRRRALAALLGGLAVAAWAWRDSHLVLLPAQTLVLAAYLDHLRKSRHGDTR